MRRMAGAAIAAAFRCACVAELAAPKPGNVHRFRAGHGMVAADFEHSAEAAAPALTRPGAPLGARIFDAVAATRAAVGQNTNLGIVLLAAPLAMAAEQGGDLRAAVARVLAAADLADAAAVFRAIALAAPGGLGTAPRHDVREEARVLLSEAMAQAAPGDVIARQWVTGFADIFTLGLPALAAARGREWPALAAYLAFLAAFPDSHIRRKHGEAVAEAVRREAAPWPARLAASEPRALLPALLAWDAALKAADLNPGTSADLTVASLFAERLLR